MANRNRRIEYDPSESSYYTDALKLLAEYRSQATAGDLASAAGSADRAAHAAEQLADHALLRVLSTQSERAVAAAMGLPRPTLQHRIKRARARLHGTTDDEAGSTEQSPSHTPAEIAAQLRATDHEIDGAAWLDELGLDRDGLLAVGSELRLSRLERLSTPQIKQRLIKQAITARRKFQGLRSGWQDEDD